jgi:fatty acid desaturase
MAEISDRVLSFAELRDLQALSDARGAVRLSIHLALLIGAGWLVSVSSGWSVLPTVFVLGLVQVALFAPTHECMHRTAFASKRANTIVGWLSACPSLLNLHFYTAFHWAHHRNTQIPGADPELLAPDPKTVGMYILRVLSIPFWQLRLRVIYDCWCGNLSAYQYIPRFAVPNIIRSVRAMSVAMVGGAIVSALLFGWQTPFLYWIGPQLLGQLPLRAYLLAEHTGCTEDGNGLTNTRTTLTSPLVRLLMWNMPFHAEHHLYPTIPFHRLHDAHASIGLKLGFVQRGYLRWNVALVRSLARQ